MRLDYDRVNASLNPAEHQTIQDFDATQDVVRIGLKLDAVNKYNDDATYATLAEKLAAIKLKAEGRGDNTVVKYDVNNDGQYGEDEIIITLRGAGLEELTADNFDIRDDGVNNRDKKLPGHRFERATLTVKLEDIPFFSRQRKRA